MFPGFDQVPASAGMTASGRVLNGAILPFFNNMHLLDSITNLLFLPRSRTVGLRGEWLEPFS